MNASRTGRRGADDGGVTGAGRGRAATKASPRSETRADSSSLTGTQGLTNARTRLVGQRTGPVADAIVVAVKVLRAVRRGSTALWRGASSVVTPLGWTVLLLVPIGLAGGRLLGWVELLTIGLAALVMIALAALFLIGRTAVDIDLVVPHERVSVGEPASGEVRVANPSRRRVLGVTVEIPVGDALVEVGLPGLRSGDAVAESFPVPTGRRGVVRIGPARTVRGDAVGLVRRELEWATVTELFVHPATIGIPSTSTGLIRDLEGSPTRDLAPDDLSFHALREYQPGDERRNIHWKSTAKAGAYMVRQFDASRRSHLVIALSLATSDFATDEEFELAVSAAGSLGARAIRDAREVSVVVSERTPDFAKRKTLAVRALSTITRNRLLDDLAVVERAESALVITDVARVARDRVAGISVAFLVVGSTTSLAEMRGAALQFPLGVEVVAIVCDPEAVPGLRRVADLTVLTIGYLDDLQKSLSRVAAS